MRIDDKSIFDARLMVKDCLAAATQVRIQLLKLATLQISREQFNIELEQVPLEEIALNHWDGFQSNSDPACTTCLEVYQLINSLSQELDYQLQFYGYDSLGDDIRQLEVYIEKLGRYQQTDKQVI